jgi:hypothetical protein
MLDHRHLLILYLLTSTRPSVLPICKTLGNPQFEHPMNQHDLRIPESDSWPSAFPPISFWAHQHSGPQLRSYLAGLCRIISGQASEARPNFERVQQYSKMRKRRLGGKTGQWMFENPGCGPVEEHHFFGISIICRLPLLILPSKNLQKDIKKIWFPEESTLPDRLHRSIIWRGYRQTTVLLPGNWPPEDDLAFLKAEVGRIHCSNRNGLHLKPWDLYCRGYSGHILSL